MPHTLKQVPISSLQIVSKSQSLQHNLLPDPLTPSHAAFEDILKSKPSVQRRSRLVDSSSHFSFVTPFHIPFPFRIEIPDDSPDVELDKATYVEKWLSNREALEEVNTVDKDLESSLFKYTNSKGRSSQSPPQLLGLAEQAIDDCLPNLDLGDALTIIDPTRLEKPRNGDNESGSPERRASIREELVNVLSGRVVLMSHVSKPTNTGPYLPWSLRYSGHQFGQWAGQLGDGRAISIMEVAHPLEGHTSYEIQLKGAGRTPYSRSADGLAVLRSSIREYLGAEAVHALKISSTRSLSIVHVPDIPVDREETETAAIVARMAPSFIRIGSFQAHNPPEELFFFGLSNAGADQKPNYEGLRILGEWVTDHVLKLERKSSREPWGKALVWECAKRNAKMVAGWQAYGFMHGVMNTDNISIMGLTIDYGPYAFMDVYDKEHICNHTDQEGRYAFKYQPTMIIYALRALLTALAPVVGAEMETGNAVVKGWTSDVSHEKLKSWEDKSEGMKNDLDLYIQDIFQEEYWTLMRKRFGLLTVKRTDEDEIVQPLLAFLEDNELDFHRTLRSLSDFSIDSDESSISSFATIIMSFSPKKSGQTSNMDRIKKWLETYSNRVTAEKEAWVKESGEHEWKATRKRVMDSVNPRFVLRQWVLEEVIKKVQEDPEGGRLLLNKVLTMATNPFRSWGKETVDELLGNLDDASDGEREERRLCGLGSEALLGFQCSCSS